MEDVEACKSYIDSFRNGVGKNCTIVSPEELGQEWLYHISVNPGIKKFVPALTQRSAPKEDRSVPRVSVATTIFGCILGYQQDRNDWEYGRSNKGWRDGWYVYGFRNEVSVKPNVKILYDADFTDERWLVPYGPDKWQYPAEIIGKYFYRSVREYQRNAVGEKTIEVFFEVAKGATVRFSHELYLTEGYWTFEFSRWVKGWDKAVIENLRELTSTEWKKVKGSTADLLSRQEPPSARW
jgi:hypothetical protein